MTDIKLEISDRAKQYSQQLQESMELGEKGKFDVDKAKVEEIFAAGLPEGINMKTVREVQDASIDFGLGHADALGTKSMGAMQADESLERTTFTSNVIGNRYTSNYVKQRTGAVDGKPWVKYGSITTDLTQGSGRKGGLNNVIRYHGELAKSVFEK